MDESRCWIASVQRWRLRFSSGVHEEIVGFLLFDFVGYWTHRLAHEVPFMWRFHAVHHSPEHMDWVSGFRIHPFDGIAIAPAFFFLIGAGFDAELAGIFVVLGSLSPLVAIPPFIALIRTRFIAVEERMLEEAFGDAYRDYMKRVRRWI